jgi:hypothetical protein
VFERQNKKKILKNTKTFNENDCKKSSFKPPNIVDTLKKLNEQKKALQAIREKFSKSKIIQPIEKEALPSNDVLYFKEALSMA